MNLERRISVTDSGRIRELDLTNAFFSIACFRRLDGEKRRAQRRSLTRVMASATCISPPIVLRAWVASVSCQGLCTQGLSCRDAPATREECQRHKGLPPQRGDTRGEVRAKFSLLQASGAAGQALRERTPREAEAESGERLEPRGCYGLLL